jgi:hypothetical protein
MTNVTELLQRNDGCNTIAKATKYHHPEVRSVIVELLRDELKKRLIARMDNVSRDVNINDMLNHGTEPSISTISGCINTLLE